MVVILNDMCLMLLYYIQGDATSILYSISTFDKIISLFDNA